MCGRFTVFSAPGDLARLFDAELRSEPLPPRYNIAPTLDVHAVIQPPEGGRRLGVLSWGLVPRWSRDGRPGPINARIETAADKPSFREPLARRRCLVPADGFYEWRTHPATGVKVPWYFRRSSGAPLALAGLWETWRGPDGARRATCAIVTTAATGVVATVHPRMPVMLPEDAWSAWLDPAADDAAEARALAEAAPHPEDLIAGPVVPAVNDVRNDGPHLLTPAPDVESGTLSRANG